MKFIGKKKLENSLGEIPIQAIKIPLTSVYLVYGESCERLRTFEEESLSREGYEGYLKLCREATFRPSRYSEFARMSPNHSSQ